MNEICHSKYEHATSEQEHLFLQQQIVRHRNSFKHTFSNSSLAQTMLTAINYLPADDHASEHIMQKLETIAFEARNDLFQLYANASEEERQTYRKKYEESLKTLWSIHRHLTDNIRTIPLNLIQIIIERCAKIGERIECIYKFKIQSDLS